MIRFASAVAVAAQHDPLVGQSGQLSREGDIAAHPCGALLDLVTDLLHAVLGVGGLLAGLLLHWHASRSSGVDTASSRFHSGLPRRAAFYSLDAWT